MIKPAHRFSDGSYRRHVQRRRPSQQYHRYSERTCRSNLAIGRRTTAVFRHDDVDGVRAKQLSFLLFRKGSAIEDIVSVRDGERRIYRIDAANQVVMPRGNCKMRYFLATDREKHFSGLLSQRIRGLPHVADFRPLIAGHRRPRRPAQRDQGCSSLPGGVQRMGRHRRCIRMSGIDQGSRAAGQRQSDRHIGTGRELLTQQSRLRGAAKNEDVLFHVAR